MRKTHLIFNILIISLLCFSFLAGCATAATPTVGPADTEVVSPTEPPQPTTPAKPFEGRSITVLLIADKTWVPDQAKVFEDETGATVNIVLADYEDMVTKFNAAAAAKSGAFDVSPGDDPTWFMAGYLEPLDDYMKDLDQTDITGLDMREYEGKRYGMPWLIDNRVFLYNTDILQQAGFDAPPKTWDEFFNQAKAIKDQGILDYPIMMPWTQHEGEFCDVSAWFKSAGGGFFNDSVTESTLNSAEDVSALDFLKRLNDAGLVNPDSLASKSFAVTQVLAQGEAAFGTSWNLLTGMLDDPSQSMQVGKVRVALYPGSSEGMTGTFDGSETLAITADSKDKELAWAFIQWITSKEIEKQTFMEQKVLPIWVSLYDDPELIAANPNLPVLKEQRQSILFRPSTGWANEFSATIQATALEAITGSKSSQQAMDDAKVAVDALLK